LLRRGCPGLRTGNKISDDLVLAVEDEDVPLHDVLRPAPAAAKAVRRLRRTCSVCAAMSPMPTMFPSASTASWPPI
jgi:hypothetical protein